MAAQIRECYKIEKQLAERLRNSTAEKRTNLYTGAYDGLFEKVPLSFLLNNYSPAAKERQIKKEVSSLRTAGNETSIYPGVYNIFLPVLPYKIAGFLPGKKLAGTK